MKIKKIKLDPYTIRMLEEKVKQLYKDKYQGLYSVAEYLLNYYYTFYEHKFNNEPLYFVVLKFKLVVWDIAKWLLDNRYEIKKKKFNFEKALKIADKEMGLTDIKKFIYTKWTKNELSKELEKIKRKLEDKQHNYTLEYYYDMISQLTMIYPKFNKKEVNEFKREIDYVEEI